MEWKDSSAFMDWYRPMLAIAESEKDEKAIWALHYEHFQQRHHFHVVSDNAIELETELLNKAKELGLKEKEIVAEHYVNFGKYNHDLLSSEQLYTPTSHRLNSATSCSKNCNSSPTRWPTCSASPMAPSARRRCG